MIIFSNVADATRFPLFVILWVQTHGYSHAAATRCQEKTLRNEDLIIYENSMKHVLKLAAFGLLFVALPVAAQVPVATHIAILKAEDARDYDGLKPFIFSKNLKIQERAILAAARIGEGSSVDALAGILENGDSSLRALAAFALGETEMDHASPFILRALDDAKVSPEVRARAVEAAGKIFAANRTGIQSKGLPGAILNVLSSENRKGSAANRPLVLLALTAALRARPDGADAVIATYLSHSDPQIVATALNTLARLRAKNVNAKSRELLSKSTDPNVRANAARLLGAAEGKESVDLLIKAVVADADSRVRISAIRSLAALKDGKIAEPLIIRGEKLIEEYKASAFRKPTAQSELLELFTALARLIPNSRNERAMNLIRQFASYRDIGLSPEAYIARVRIAPHRVIRNRELVDWRQYSSLAQVLGEFAEIEPDNDEAKKMKVEAPRMLKLLIEAYLKDDTNKVADPANKVYAAPDFLQAYAKFKTDDLPDVLRANLLHSDLFVRAAAAGLLADQPPTKLNVDALKAAFAKALVSDKSYNDAQLAILDALFKLDKKESVGSLLVALNAPDYLVRKKAFDLLSDEELEKDFPVIETSLENARADRKDHVLPYAPAVGTKLGQLLNTDADYRRAVGRKNGSVKAILTTEKGTFTIDLLPEDAPLTVDNFVKLANAKYFNGLEVHRVVSNFVMQDGDPRGDGNGGPGWSIRCEMNMVPFDRGAVGMALSGKDTGGSQWFVTHAPQPHLDGGYTVFGRVNETDMKVVDNIVRGDKILTVKIVESKTVTRNTTNKLK